MALGLSFHLEGLPFLISSVPRNSELVRTKKAEGSIIALIPGHTAYLYYVTIDGARENIRVIIIREHGARRKGLAFALISSRAQLRPPFPKGNQ